MLGEEALYDVVGGQLLVAVLPQFLVNFALTVHRGIPRFGTGWEKLERGRVMLCGAGGEPGAVR
jgi:hypothetical protein